MKRVVTPPARNAGWSNRVVRKARLVFTPRMRNSWMARLMRAMASSRVGAQAVTFSRSES
jgi:hypothetical protein